MPKPSSFILESAKRNAELRFRDLLQEARLLLQLFPDLRDAFDADELPIAFIVARGSGRLRNTQNVRRRRTSAAARKAAGLRMKKHRAAKP
jgi:hypothetical protein